MAHELDYSTGMAAFAEAGDRVTAWHGEGRTVRPGLLEMLDPEEKSMVIMQAAKLDWEVEARDIRIHSGEFGQSPLIPGWKAFTRSDNGRVLTVAPESYTPLQNRELLRLVEPMMGEGIFRFETAGALRDGQDVWALFTFNPKDEAVAAYFGAEGIIPYALLANNHARSRAVTIMETPVRVVCANTLGMAAGSVGKKAGRYPGAISLRHTSNVKSASVEAVQQLWGQITERYRAVAGSYEALKATYLEQEEFEREVLDVLAPLPEDTEAPRFESTLARQESRRSVVQGLWEGEGRGLRGDGSAWEAYNAAAEALDHYPDAFPTRKNRLQGLFPGGTLASKKQDVLNGLHALATVK
jgi:phage/plasmid-like protein (TIGR03299 family)